MQNFTSSNITGAGSFWWKKIRNISRYAYWYSRIIFPRKLKYQKFSQRDIPGDRSSTAQYFSKDYDLWRVPKIVYTVENYLVFYGRSFVYIVMICPLHKTQYNDTQSNKTIKESFFFNFSDGTIFATASKLYDFECGQ